MDLNLLIEQLAQSVALKLEPLLRQEQADQWLTVKEAADHLHCSTKTVYELSRKGELPSHKLGGTLRFSRTELDKALLT